MYQALKTRVLRPGIIMFTVAALLANLAWPALATAADTYTPPTGPLFNDPRGDSKARDRIVNNLNQMIDHSPKGSAIRFATFSFGLESTAQALISAHKRGVSVRMVMPANDKDRPVVKELAAALGTRAGTGSYVVFCTGSCYRSGTTGTNHMKLYLFSRTGTAQNVIVTSSSNIDTLMTDHRYNDSFTVAGDATAYVTARTFFDHMHLDRRGSVPPPLTSQRRSYYYFPRSNANFYYNVFKGVTCTGALNGTGANGHTVIRLATSLWDNTRADVAERLVALRSQGCSIQVIAQSKHLDARILKRLTDGGVAIRYADKLNGSYSNHSKFIAISGHFLGNRAANDVFTGSLNLIAYGNTSCDNNMFRATSRQVYEAYVGHYSAVWAKSLPPSATDMQQAPLLTNAAAEEQADE